MKTTEKYIGEFTVGSKIIVTDPCYERVDETSRLQAVLDVKPGVWNAQIIISDEGDWGKRVAELHAWYNTYSGRKPNEYVTNCGVDSGQLGFFDYDKYPIGVNGYEPEYEDPDNWYKKACNETYQENNREKKAGIVECMGVNSSSGFGDGSYDVYVARDADDKVVSIKAVFIDEEDEDYD